MTTPIKLGMVPSSRFQTKAISGSPAVIRRHAGSFAEAHQRDPGPIDVGRSQGQWACITVMSKTKQALCQPGHCRDCEASFTFGKF
ncbi:hypothetical protein ACU4GH_29385 [Bradyrhizobium betae]|uniref:hypothetical protein n=1 Tax=Bradyrhizobium betae TaxID=244734 RepID=UPI003D67018E